MKSSRWQKFLNHFSGLFLFVFIFLNALSTFAVPGKTTYQAKIVKPDGYPLEASSVNFKFTILDPAGSCILYSETYSSVNMSSTGGLISFSLGSGVKTYPTSATTFEQVFSNITPSLSCDTGGPANYVPVATDIRKIVMQFHDGSGWQTLPAMSINAVPYAMYANEATKLNGLTSSDFVQVSTVPTCATSEALRYTGASFSCVAVGNSVTSSTVVTALGYTPADGASVTTLTSNVSSVSSTVASVSSTVFSVSSTVTSLQNSVAASFAAMTSSQWTTSGTNIFYNTGNVGIGTTTPVTKLDVSGGVRIGAESTTCAPALAGTLRYNATNVEYCNGTSWQAFGVSSSGLTSLNGSTSQTQTFANATGGTAPNFNTSNGVHTLNIPLASTGSVTAGLLSNADYTTFTNKITSSAASIAQVLGYIPADNAASGTYAQKANNLSDLTNIATARTNLGLGTFATASSIDLGSASATGTLAIARLPSFSGDATIAAASNTIIFSNSGVTAGTYTKVTVDTKGRVTSSSALASTDVTTALGYTPASATASTQWTTSGSAIYYNTGNVGIGTAAPGTALDVLGTISSRSSSTWGSGANSTFKAVDPNGLLFSLGLDAGNTKLELNTQYSTMPIVFSVGNSEKMRITSSNYVGIGISSPQSKLHIGGGISGAYRSWMDNGVIVGKSGESDGGYFGLKDEGVNRQDTVVAWGDDPSDNLRFIFTASGGVSDGEEVMRMTGAGNVGIGTINPSAKLHLSAGTSSTASFKFTSGTLLTSPQAGAMEYDGTNFYLTDSTNTRRAIAANTNPGTYDNVSNINSSSNITLTPTGSVVVSSTTASTNSNTGALVVKGGLGVAGDIYTSGTIVTSSNIQGVSVTATSGMISPYIYGSTLASGNLTLGSTTNATKGNVLVAPNGGNVGIGTTAPAHKLTLGSGHLAVEGGNIYLASGNSMQFNYGVANDYGIYKSGTNLLLTTGGTFSFSGGNVGIGTTSPQTSLHIVTPGVQSNSPSEGISLGKSLGNDYQIQLTQAGGTPHIDFARGGNADYDARISSPVNNALWLGTTSSSALLALNGLNVGVGTTSPGEKLEVVGGNAQIRSSSTMQAVGTPGGLRIYNTQSTNSSDYLNIGWIGENTYAIQSADESTYRTLTFNPYGGNVGIGTTSPSTALEVSGTVKATAFSGPGILLQSINLAAADFVSHTTSVWLDVPNLSSTFTTAVPTTVDIVASGMYRTMNASVGNVRLVINGTEVAGDYIQQAPSTGTLHANTSINWAQTLAAGTHTIKVQWRNENATGSFDQGWNDSGRVLSRRLKIMVYSQ